MLKSDIDEEGDEVVADAAEVIDKKAENKSKERKRAMKLFVKQEDSKKYTVPIENVMRYELDMDFVSCGISLRQVASDIQYAKDHTKTDKLTDMNEIIVGQYVRALVGVVLQKIADILDDALVWAMSLDGDGSTHRG